jgi:hypothetical protein
MEGKNAHPLVTPAQTCRPALAAGAAMATTVPIGGHSKAQVVIGCNGAHWTVGATYGCVTPNAIKPTVTVSATPSAVWSVVIATTPPAELPLPHR